jgi:hypothetical protein
MPAQRGLRAPVAHVLLGRLDATGTSPEDTTGPVGRSSRGRPLRHVGRLADAPEVPSDARWIRDKREQLHPSAAAWAGQNVDPKGPFEKLRPRTIGASARALGLVRRGFWRNLRLRRETGPQLTRRRKHARVPNGMQARCGHRRRETTEQRQRIHVHRHRGGSHFMLGCASARPFVDPEARSVFLDGEILLMLEARESVRTRESYAILAKERAKYIESAMRRSPTLSAESYPDECWTFCNTTALAGLAVLDHVHGSDHGALGREWVSRAKERLVDARTGILVSSFTRAGQTLDGPEGSSIWMSASNMLFVDEAFANDQYRRARRELGKTTLGFGWAREWPSGVPERPDVDSGPIVPFLGASAGASGLACWERRPSETPNTEMPYLHLSSSRHSRTTARSATGADTSRAIESETRSCSMPSKPDRFFAP